MRRAFLSCAILTAVLAAGTGCAAPSYTFVSNAKDHLYFKVPTGWQRIDETQLEAVATAGMAADQAAALRAATWSVAYDADPHPSVIHVLATHTDRPIVLSRVLHVPEGNRDSITVDSLRNAFVPITKEARLTALASGTQLPKAEIRTNKLVTKGGLKGVHVVFRMLIGSAVETFDQTAVKAGDGSKIYLFLVRCGQTCYAQHYNDELADVVRSFTVETTP